MTRDELVDVVEKALRKAFGTLVFDHAEVMEGADHDGDPSLFVTAHYKAGTDTVDQTKALTAVRDGLLAAGDSRFPYMNHIYPGDQFAEDDEPIAEQPGP